VCACGGVVAKMIYVDPLAGMRKAEKKLQSVHGCASIERENSRHLMSADLSGEG
jgi:hypothetical protein